MLWNGAQRLSFCFVRLIFQNWACNPQITATVHRLWRCICIFPHLLCKFSAEHWWQKPTGSYRPPGSSPNLRFSFQTALFLPFSTHPPLTQRSSEQQWWPSEWRRWHLHRRVSPSSAGWPASPTRPGLPAFPRRYAGHRPPEVGSLGCKRKESTQMTRCIKSHKGVESAAAYKSFTVILL